MPRLSKIQWPLSHPQVIRTRFAFIIIYSPGILKQELRAILIGPE